MLRAALFHFKTKRKLSQTKLSRERPNTLIKPRDIIDGSIIEVESTENAKEIEIESSTNALSQLPDWIAAAKHSYENKMKHNRVTFILDKASLTLAHVGNQYRILNPVRHADYMRKKKLDPYKYRPDIVHEALRQIMTSRLCLAGRLEAVYIKTDEGVLIKVDPRANIPKSLDEFCHMMSELLQNLSIKSSGKGGRTLLRLVKNPVTQHLPVNSFKIGLSSSSNKVVELRDYVVGDLSDDHVNLVFVVGAMARGSIDGDYTDDLISISGDHLSAAFCLSRICIALERNWNIL